MDLLTIKEAAIMLRLSTNRVYQLVKEQVIPSTKISGSIRIIREELEKKLKSHNSIN